MALTASPQSALPTGPSWDETIVPSLRKRLETESRILSKRLSTISITDEGPPQAPQRTKSPPQDNADAYPLRPSAIPRPSYSSRPAASPSPPPAEPARKAAAAAPSKRQRTQSTPFPFDNSSQPAPNGHAHAMPTSHSPSPSGSMSPRVQSPPLPRAAPSRIPTVSSRTRSGSHSSQSLSAKSSVPPSHKFPSPELPPREAHESITPPESLRHNASTSSFSRQRIVDERPPFTNEPPPNVLEREFTGGRPSAEEERTFQHWYRGDVSRNGGVGEYRVGKRMEMLDIANFGHDYRRPAVRTHAYEEPIMRSEDIGVIPRKRAESVSSRERASIYIDPQDDGAVGRVLDETPLTDIEADQSDYDREQNAYAYEPPTDFGLQQYRQQQQRRLQQQLPNSVAPALSTNHNRGNSEAFGPSATLPSRLPSSAKPQTRIPQAQTRKVSAPSATSVPVTTPEPTTPAKLNLRDRGRPQATTNSRAKPATKPKAQKRSKSAGDTLQSSHGKRESADYGGLADAVPETSSPRPRDGNWDNVILPTVARRMGIEYEKEDPISAAQRKARESRVAPAPGTFGYDHTKYKPPREGEDIPMDEFGLRPERVLDVTEEVSEAPPPSPMATTLRSRRETMPSSAPFSDYMVPNEAPVPDISNRRRRKERQDVPQILVTQPTIDDRAVYVEEGESSGCCKCVIM